MRAPVLGIIVIATALAACASSDEPTLLAAPPEAIDVNQVQLIDVDAHETYFTMRVRFPANPALDHYSKTITDPWVRCDWSPKWERFVDATVKPARTVHQQMYMWINRPARRTLLLANRYYSSENWVGNPENDDQQVILVEYMNQDIDNTIATLKLRCPNRKDAL